MPNNLYEEVYHVDRVYSNSDGTCTYMPVFLMNAGENGMSSEEVLASMIRAYKKEISEQSVDCTKIQAYRIIHYYNGEVRENYIDGLFQPYSRSSYDGEIMYYNPESGEYEYAKVCPLIKK